MSKYHHPGGRGVLISIFNAMFLILTELLVLVNEVANELANDVRTATAGSDKNWLLNF